MTTKILFVIVRTLVATVASAPLFWVTPVGAQLADIPAPVNWVAFSADRMSTNEATPDSYVYGRYYRRSDGSTRSDAGVKGESIQSIEIHNMTNSTYYTFFRGSWESYKMRLPEEGYTPAVPRLGKTNFLAKSDEFIQGFDNIYTETQPSGLVRHEAPALNFFALRQTYQGAKTEYYNVQIAEQPDDLFVPPPGAPINAHDTLWGFIGNVTKEEEKQIEEEIQRRIEQVKRLHPDGLHP